MIDEHEVEEPRPFERSITERMQRRIKLNIPPGRPNPQLRRFIEAVNSDDELYALWLAANVNAIERLGMTDHGPVHVKIVMNIAIKLFRLMVEGGVPPSLVNNYELEPNDAEVVVAAAALFHDLGMSIHRVDHENFSLFVAQPKLKEIFEQIYDVPTATIMRSETLHAIISHRSRRRSHRRRARHGQRPLTHSVQCRLRQYPFHFRGGNRGGASREG
jgi:metal-dependent HD superfamily phosphatase/phosphodiesterase